jgi:hypothetical protein
MSRYWPPSSFDSSAENIAKDRWGVTQDCMSSLKAYSWPGNVRELRNAHRARRCLVPVVDALHLLICRSTQLIKLLEKGPIRFHDSAGRLVERGRGRTHPIHFGICRRKQDTRAGSPLPAVAGDSRESPW